MAGQSVGDSPSDLTIPLRDRHADLASAAAIDDAAFEQLLKDEGGPWHPRASLVLFTDACVLAFVQLLLPEGCTPDQVDQDGISTEALLQLRRTMPHTSEALSEWYRGTIRRLVIEEIDQVLSMPNQAPASNRAQEGGQTLPPSLRTTAQLLLVEHAAPDDICEILGIARALLDQRIDRINRCLPRP